jgi:hypothetical protein
MNLMNKFKQAYARLQFWWVKKTLISDKDFTLSADELEPGETLRIEILRGKFAKVQFSYSDLYLSEDENGLLTFHTRVVYNPSKLNVFTKKFEELTANILRVILIEGIAQSRSKQQTEQGMTDENRKNDTDELDEERKFHEEKSPLLEKRVSKRKSRAKDVSGDSGVHPDVQQPAKRKRTKAATRSKGKSN